MSFTVFDCVLLTLCIKSLVELLQVSGMMYQLYIYFHIGCMWQFAFSLLPHVYSVLTMELTFQKRIHKISLDLLIKAFTCYKFII